MVASVSGSEHAELKGHKRPGPVPIDGRSIRSIFRRQEP